MGMIAGTICEFRQPTLNFQGYSFGIAFCFLERRSKHTIVIDVNLLPSFQHDFQHPVKTDSSFWTLGMCIFSVSNFKLLN